MRSVYDDLFEHLLPSDICLEAGSYDGRDAIWLSCQTIHVHAVEADPILAEQCAVAFAQSPHPERITLHKGALSDQSHPVWFKRSSVPGSGSVLPPTGHLTHWPHVSFQEQLVPAIYARMFAPTVIWFDLQGYEGKLLSSCPNLLNARLIYLEAERFEMFDGQYTRQQLLDLLLPTHKLIGDYESPHDPGFLFLRRDV